LTVLLDRLADAGRRGVIGRDGEGARSLRLLEFERVTAQIARHCHNRLAAEAVRGRLPYTSDEPINLRHKLADELRPLGDREAWPPLADVSTGLELLASPPPLQLSGSELIAMASTAEAVAAVREFLLSRRDDLPTWCEAANETVSPADLASDIRRALARDGRVVDSASTLLARLRGACSRQRQAVRRSVDAAMAAARRDSWTTGSEVTLRGDRYCLPIRAGDRRKVTGIVHDRSASGATLFVEPAGVVQLHNDLIELQLEAAAEEARILLDLNQKVERGAERLREGAELLLLADEVKAALIWSVACAGRRPSIAAGGPLRICQGRHPLLLEMAATGGAAVVPLDLEPPANAGVVVISGPNAGGKSVALKSIGVFCLLAQCGWDIPARDDTCLPLVSQLFVDLGDEQSIAQSLSSFSAHLNHLARFVRKADAASLVLCDEIGGGTDPDQGTALAFAVLEILAERGARVLASTHFGLLKAAVHDHRAMVNAAMDFDTESHQPRYTLRMGIPGASEAFAVASRCGFADDLLARARSMVGEERFEIERLLGELGRRTRDLAVTESTLQQELREQRRLRDDLAIRLADLDRERQAVLDRTRATGEELLAEGRRTIERAVREIRSADADGAVIRAGRDALADLKQSLPTEPPTAAQEFELRPGDKVRIPHLGLTGSVVEVRKGRVTALADGLRLSLDRAAVVPAELVDPKSGTEPAGTADNAVPAGSWRWAESPPEVVHEVDLRGIRGEEAWEQLDRLIDRAIPAGLNEIRVIHGVGTGRLRAYLLACLKDDIRVAETHQADLRAGGFGVSVVRLVDDS